MGLLLHPMNWTNQDTKKKSSTKMRRNKKRIETANVDDIIGKKNMRILRGVYEINKKRTNLRIEWKPTESSVLFFISVSIDIKK